VIAQAWKDLCYTSERCAPELLRELALHPTAAGQVLRAFRESGADQIGTSIQAFEAMVAHLDGLPIWRHLADKLNQIEDPWAVILMDRIRIADRSDNPMLLAARLTHG